MKNKTKLMNLCILTALVVGCKVIDPTPTTTETYAEYSIIDGDTVKTRNEQAYKDKKLKEKLLYGTTQIVIGETVQTYKEPKLHTPPAKDPDLGKLKNNDDPDLKGKPLRMVAIGGSLTAGVRDGGYFNEGMLTSYPNLIARQMKLKKFEQPLFDKEDYNGFGRKVPTTENPTKGPVPKFKAVMNNTGLETIEDDGKGNKKVKLKKYKGNDIDNWGFPYLQAFNYVSDLPNYNVFLDRIDKTDRKERYLVLGQQIDKQKFDFFLMEQGWSEYIDHTSYLFIRPNGTPDPFEDMLKMAIKKKAMGAMINLPNFYEFPLYTTLKPESLRSYVQYKEMFTSLFDINGNQIQDFIIHPNSTLDSLLSPKVNINIKPKDLPAGTILISKNVKNYSISSIITANQRVESYSKKYNYPVVDLYTLYQKIIAGTYITDDGLKVDGSYPNGNFFSSDMAHPTAFGQAVIANEVIKTINNFYKIEIPLISTREYLSIK